MSLIAVPWALSNRPWARLRARKEGASFIVISKSCRCSWVRGCTYRTIITSSSCTKGAMKICPALMRYTIGIVSENFWSSTYQQARRVEQAVGEERAGGPSREALLAENQRLREENRLLWELLDEAESLATVVCQKFAATAWAMGVSLGQIVALLAIVRPACRV